MHGSQKRLELTRITLIRGIVHGGDLPGGIEDLAGIAILNIILCDDFAGEKRRDSRSVSGDTMQAGQVLRLSFGVS